MKVSHVASRSRVCCSRESGFQLESVPDIKALLEVEFPWTFFGARPLVYARTILWSKFILPIVIASLRSLVRLDLSYST